jgi:transposase-like protein
VSIGLEEKWGKQYGLALKGWKENWEELSTYFKYSMEVRKLIYRTNPIEGFHRQVRKYTKTKGSFSTENGLLKLVYSAIRQIGSKWNQSLANWALTMSQLEIFFPGRLDLKAAFELHQATECYYSAFLLVFIDHRPKTHDLFVALRLN